MTVIISFITLFISLVTLCRVGDQPRLRVLRVEKFDSLLQAEDYIKNHALEIADSAIIMKYDCLGLPYFCHVREIEQREKEQVQE